MNVILRHHCCCCRVSLVTTLYWLNKNSRNYNGTTKYMKSNMVYCLMIRIMKIYIWNGTSFWYDTLIWYDTLFWYDTSFWHDTLFWHDISFWCDTSSYEITAQSWMDNAEKLAKLSTQDTGRRQRKQKHHTENK